MGTKLKFKRIQPNEVVAGDIIVIPKEEKGTKNKLHLTPYTMKKHGLNYRLKHQLTYDELFGKSDTTLCVITQVYNKYYRDIELIKNVSNSVKPTGSFKAPIEKVNIIPLISREAAYLYSNSIMDIMAEANITEKDLKPLNSKIERSDIHCITGLPGLFSSEYYNLSKKGLYEKINMRLTSNIHSHYISIPAYLRFLEFIVKQGAYILRPENPETSKHIAMTIYSSTNKIKHMSSQINDKVQEYIKELRQEVKDLRKKYVTWEKFYKMYNNPKAITQALNKVCGIKKESLS